MAKDKGFHEGRNEAVEEDVEAISVAASYSGPVPNFRGRQKSSSEGRRNIVGGTEDLGFEARIR